MSGQSIMDRMTAAKHSIAGQGLAKVVCKATTEEVMGPKKKHLDYLLQCTNEPNVSIPQLADLLLERTQHANWVVVFKSLISIHNLINYGNERFTQYLASNNCTLNLGNFMDKGGVQGYDMSTFIRRYSKYLNEKAYSYRQMAFDFCKVRRGKEDGLLRTMNAEKLLKTLPALQKLLDALLDFDCSQNELTNGVINACFLLMFKDLIRLFACYNDGIINLLEKYFDMNKKQCKEALDLYKKFLVRMDKVSEFLKVAENVGIDKGDIPDLAKGLRSNTNGKNRTQRTISDISPGRAPSSLLDALEQHLNSLEGKKGATTPVGSKPAGFNTALNTISSNSSVQISDEEKKRIIDEENAKLQQLKEQRLKEVKTSENQTTTGSNPFASPTTAPSATQNSHGLDLLSSPTQPTASQPSDDLLNLSGNPFIENVQSVMQKTSVRNDMQTNQPFAAGWSNGTTQMGSSTASSGFTSDADFEKVFQNSGPSTKSAYQQTPFLQEEVLLDPLDPLAGGTSVSGDLPIPGAMATDPLDPLAGGMSACGSTPISSAMATDPLDQLDPLAGVTGMGAMSAPPVGLSTSPVGALGGFSSMPMSIPHQTVPGSVGPKAHSLGTSPQAFADLAMPSSPGNVGRSSPALSTTSDQGTGFDAFGEVLQPINKQSNAEPKKQEKLIKQDLNESLAQLAGNLNIKGSAAQVKKQQHEWQPKGEQKKTGGSSWTPPTQNVSSTTWTPGSAPVYQQSPVQGGMGYMGQQPMMGNMMAGGPRPMGMMGQGMAPMGMQPQYNMGMQPNMGMNMQQPRPPMGQQNDPFGAL